MWEMSIESFEKFLHIAGNLEGHNNDQGCIYAQKSLKKIQKYHLVLLWDSAQRGSESSDIVVNLEN